MTIVRPIAGSRAHAGTLGRLAPGALLCLAITRTDAAGSAEAWHFGAAAVAHTETFVHAETVAGAETALTQTIARTVGLAQDAVVHTTIVCDGLAHHERPAPACAPVTETHLPWTMLLDAEEARGQELRFITGRIDPPPPAWGHG